LAERLSEHFKVYAPDLAGHGGKPFPAEPFSMKLFAEGLLAFMDREHLDKVSIFGYSMGGYVGMYVAKHHPERIDKVVTLATKFHWDEAIATKEIQMLDP
jgi:pimeloyl-ACP methyl ester carboxylesterase